MSTEPAGAFQRRIQVLTGKGGVGKTTVAAALGAAYAARGLETIIAETAGTDAVPPLFGAEGAGYKAIRLAPKLHTLSISPEKAIEDYVVQQVKFRKLYQLVFKNRVMGPFVDAVPGLHDVIQLGKVFDLAREVDARGEPRWDRIIVDAPATGHGVTMLAAPAAMMEMTRAGPMFEGARKVHEVLSDPETASVIIVSLPEDMPVNETIELWQRLGRLREQVGACVLNQIYPPPFPARADWAEVRQGLLDATDPGVREAALLADAWLDRMDRQAGARRRLGDELPMPLVDNALVLADEITPNGLRAMGERLLSESAAQSRGGP